MTIEDVINRRIEWIKSRHLDHPVQNHMIDVLNELKKDFEAFDVLNKIIK